MKRRKFVQSSIAASALPISLAGGLSLGHSSLEGERELIEIRTYEMNFGGNRNMLLKYLKNALEPALARVGVSHFMMLGELGNSDPSKIWVVISYPNAEIYLRAQDLAFDMEYVNASAEYNELSPEKPIYTRITSSLLLAFEGMPKMVAPIDGASLFELRTYEGYSEDAVRRKIKMFNVEEIPLFLKVGLHPVFFGDMIIGPHRPCLTYMINFKDMEEHDANWKTFIDHPEWNAMKIKGEYANTVSNIRKQFLVPV